MMPSRLFERFMPMDLIRSLLGSSALRAATALGVSGLALACGNLMLARSLPADEFARFVLVYSIVMIGVNIGPIGADVILTRRHFDPGPKLHAQVLLTSGSVAVILAIISGLIYPLNFGLLVAILVAVSAGGVKVVAVAHYRSQQRFAGALALTISTNAAVLVAAGVTVAVGGHSALLPAVILAIALCAVALVAWRAVTAERQQSSDDSAMPYPWRDSLSAVSFIAASMIHTSFERLITPGLLNLQALATFSVLATVAVSPFTMLYQGVGYTLVPGLRSANNRLQRRQVFAHESVVIGATCLVAGLVAVWLTPLVLKYVLSDRYQVSWPLLLVAIFVGMLRVSGSLPAAAVNALGSPADLIKLSVAGWLAIVISLIGAAIGAHWGLIGLVSGVGAGWLVRAVVIGWLAAPHLSDSESDGPAAREARRVIPPPAVAQRLGKSP
jgi:O-antigen/teichoic acid export membrane protein